MTDIKELEAAIRLKEDYLEAYTDAGVVDSETMSDLVILEAARKYAEIHPLLEGMIEARYRSFDMKPPNPIRMFLDVAAVNIEKIRGILG